MVLDRRGARRRAEFKLSGVLNPRRHSDAGDGGQAEHHHAAQPVNELGVAEPVIQQQGLDRVVVQLPGVQDTAKAKDIIGRTATLEVRMVDDSAEAAAAAARQSLPGALRHRGSSSTGRLGPAGESARSS